MPAGAPPGMAPRPRWWGTIAYVPALYLIGWTLSRPLGALLPDWRADQVDLAGVVLAFALLLLSLPRRLRRVWGARHPWRRLGLARPAPQAAGHALAGIAQALALLGLVSGGLLLSRQAHWVGQLPEPGRWANALVLGTGVGLAEELLFRGWLWGELKLLLKSRQALVLQAAIFALIHPWYRAPGLLAFSQLAGLILLGLALALERRRAGGSLWGAAGLHGGLVGGWFLLQSGALKVSATAPGWWAGPGGTDPNPIGGLLGCAALLLLLLSQRGSPGGRKGASPTPAADQSIRVVMMQRDEGELLNVWVRYHARIVGARNLCIVDHGSTCAITLRHLESAESLGATVIRDKYRTWAFELKGQVLETEIKRLPASHAYLPLDCDEFLCLEHRNKIDCNPKAILHYLQNLKPQLIYKTKRRLNNAPWDTSVFLPMTTERPGKIFMTTKRFQGLDLGSHGCEAPPSTTSSRLSHLHLHNKPFRWLVESSETKLRAHGVDTNSREALLLYQKQRLPGWHLCHHLLISEEEWLSELRQVQTITTRAFDRQLRKLELTHPFQQGETREHSPKEGERR